MSENFGARALGYLLRPISWVWLAAVVLRGWAYHSGLLRQRRLAGAVISVGNLTVGGTGKTPLVQWLMERLAREGKSAGVLTRGYQGFLRGGLNRKRTAILRVPDAREALHERDAEETPSNSVASDEVCLLLHRLGMARRESQNAEAAVWLGVGADRYSVGMQLEQRSVDWFVLDDGFQHWQLHRNVDIVLIDAGNPFGNGQLLPAGRLREPASALKRADVIVITRSEGSPAIEAAIRRYTAAPVFYGRTKLKAIRRAVLKNGLENGPGGQTLNPAEYSGHRFFAFCGIGNPRAFFADARRWGVSLCGERAFPDHHRYSREDGFRLQEQARNTGATGLLCTEKDACNLVGAFDGGLSVYYTQISMDVLRGDEFWCTVMDAVERNRSRSDAGARR